MIIKIKDYDYRIEEVDENYKEFFNDEKELIFYGRTIYEKQLIQLYKHLNSKRKRDTLIHELTHAFYDVYLNSYHIKDKFDEEDICSFMASYSEMIIDIANRYFEIEKMQGDEKNG